MTQVLFPRSRAFFGTLSKDLQGDTLELMLKQLYQQILLPGDAALDCGANVGMHTIPMAKSVAPDGRVLAIEALPTLARGALAEKVKASGLSEFVEIINLAIGESSGQATFHEYVAGRGYSSLRERSDLPEEILASCVEHTLPLTTIDALVKETLAPDKVVRFIKMDLEGGEFGAIKGARRVMERHSPVIAIEFGLLTASKSGFRSDELFDLLEESGYALATFLGEPLNGQTFGREYFVWNSVACRKERLPEITAILRRSEKALGLQLPE